MSTRTNSTDAEACIRMVKDLMSYGMIESKALSLVANAYSNVLSLKTLTKLYHKDIYNG